MQVTKHANDGPTLALRFKPGVSVPPTKRTDILQKKNSKKVCSRDTIRLVRDDQIETIVPKYTSFARYSGLKEHHSNP